MLCIPATPLPCRHDVSAIQRNPLALYLVWHSLRGHVGRGGFYRRAGKQTDQPVSRPVPGRDRRASALHRHRSADPREGAAVCRPPAGRRLQPGRAGRAADAL